MRVVVWGLVAVPVVGFSLGCIGCGTEEPPEEAEIGRPWTEKSPIPTAEPTGDTAATTGDTGAVAVLDDSACTDRAPGLVLGGLDEVSLVYGGPSCSGPMEHGFEVVATGLSTLDPADASWTLTIDGKDSQSGTIQLPLTCGEDGTAVGHLALGLPKVADGRAVTVELVLVDTFGTEVDAAVTFIAHVEK